MTLRVVFGLDELREKLVLEDARLDDAYVEYLKVLVLNDHPFLLQKPRMNLLVDTVDEDEIRFVATFDHEATRYRVRLPWESVTDVEVAQTRAWARRTHRESLFSLTSGRDYWVNFLRWAPASQAKRSLKEFADALRAGGEIDLDGREFELMLDHLPRGNRLTSAAKRDLRIVQSYARSAGREDIQDTLFEIRFGFELEDDWSRNNDPDDIDTLWDLLKDLPDSNVEGNTSISEIELDVGKGGGWYWGRTKEIGIGELELPDAERFANVVRHEVGHAVHDKKRRIVDQFLESGYGWQTFQNNNRGIDQWVALMGGWGNLNAQEKQQVRGLIRYGLGDENWEHKPIWVPDDHVWNQNGFGPRLAFEGSILNGRYWWINNQNWYQANGKAFAYNFYYKQLMVVDVQAISALQSMPDAYAAMSPSEFFAELYAVYYDLDADISFLPETVHHWFESEIGRRGEQTD